MAVLTDYPRALQDLARDINEIAEQHGFWDYEDIGDDALIPLKISLIHAEASEALEVVREHYDDAEPDPVSGLTPLQEDDLCEELADIVIRVLDLAAGYELDIGQVLIAKVEKNRSRPRKHGKRF